MARTLILIGIALAGGGVLAGAFGAHALNATLTANGRADTYQTAVQYQMYHALALFAVVWLYEKWPGRWVRWAGGLFTFGVLVFSGSLYILSIFDVRVMGAVTPLGGIALVGGWLCLGIAVWQGNR